MTNLFPPAVSVKTAEARFWREPFKPNLSKSGVEANGKRWNGNYEEREPRQDPGEEHPDEGAFLLAALRPDDSRAGVAYPVLL